MKDGNLARSFNALGTELARPFDNDAVSEAITACIECDEDFIAGYMEEHFMLQAETITLPCTPEGAAAARPELPGGAVGIEGNDASLSAKHYQLEAIESNAVDQEGEAENEDMNRSPRHRQKVSVFERFAPSIRYHWDEIRQRFVHPDAIWIERGGSPFHWLRFDTGGNIITRFWVSKQSLTRGGIEIAAELWEILRGNPNECSIVLMAGDDSVKELSGSVPLQMVKDRVIELYPAKHRMREVEKA